MDQLVLNLLTLGQKGLCKTAIWTHLCAYKMWDWGSSIEKHTRLISLRKTSAYQWGNRLDEFCLNDEAKSEFWHMVGSGIAPYHAFSMITGNTNA